MNDCTHKTLYFGSGGYYIFCKNCNCVWVSRIIEENNECREGNHRYEGTMMSNFDERKE